MKQKLISCTLEQMTCVGSTSLTSRSTPRMWINVPTRCCSRNSSYCGRLRRTLQRLAPGGVNISKSSGISQWTDDDWSHSWTLTRLRQGKWHRIEIDYIGRAGYVSGKPPALRRPPFIAVLQGQRLLS